MVPRDHLKIIAGQEIFAEDHRSISAGQERFTPFQGTITTMIFGQETFTWYLGTISK